MNTDLKEELIERLKERDLTNSSIKAYIRNLEKLNGDEPLENFNFLKKKSEVDDYLEGYKENTKRNYYISIASVLSVVKDESDALNNLYKYYYGKMMEYNKMLKNEESKNEINAKQSENWLSWKAINEKFEELEEEVSEFIDKKKLTKAEYNILLDYVILSLYVLQPPRRNEYINMMVFKKVTDDMDNSYNYIVLDKKEFIFNAFKTVKKEGVLTIPINDDLMWVISNYLKHHPLMKEAKKHNKNTNYEVPFLVKHDGSALKSQNAITLRLNKIFGKKLGSSALRHIYLSDKYGDEIKEKQKDAQLMSHSVGMQSNYIKKDVPK